MMITADTACGREVRVRAKDVHEFPWGSAVMCCSNCSNIALARNSWYEVYA